MLSVKTIFGEISPRDLGFVDSHDHLWKCGGMEVTHDKDFALDNLEKCRTELQSFIAAGGKTMVDMQPLGLGRDIEKLKTIAADLPVNVISVTGFHKGSFYDKIHFANRYDIDQLIEMVAAEVTEGIEVNDYCGPFVKRSDTKAGLVKAGTSYYKVSALEDKLLRVVARVSKKTGIPVITHTDYGTMGLEQVKILKDEGVEPEKICIGHLDRNPDPYYHASVLKEGVFVQYDCVARIKYHTVAASVDLIKKFSNEGYADKLLIGGDWGRASYFKAYAGGPGLEYLPKTFTRILKEDYSVSEEVIRKIFYDNPSKYLAY